MPARKRRTWIGRVYLGEDPGGHQQYHWVGRYTTRRERDDAVAKARLERPWQAAGADGTTCEQWADRMLTRMETGALRTRSGRRYKASSIDTARSQLKAFRHTFGARTPESITRTEAEDWAASVEPSKLPIVIQLMNELLRAEEIDRNRFAGLSRRPVADATRRPPSEEEMVLLMDGCAALGPAYAPIMRALFTFATYTIMRPGELMAFDWHDVDLHAGAHGRAVIRHRYYRGTTDLPKSNRERTITLVPAARAVLDTLLTIPGYPQHGLVFRNKTGGPLTAPTLSAYWKQVCARARLEPDFYVATKHYGVWYMKVVLALPDAAIAAQAGWSEQSVTKMIATYAHAVDERRLDEIDAAFAAIPDANPDAHHA